MRKLIIITVLLSFFGYMGMVGQNVPVLVAGKVHISGPMYSLGAVHVDTITVDSAMIDIDNGINGATAILMTDSIIFYSNDSFEGLLRNGNSSGTGGVGGITNADYPSKVIVRKTLTGNKYTYVSLPFNCTLTSVLRGGTNTLMPFEVNGSGYWIQEFDAKLRAENMGFLNPDIWRYMAATETMKRGMGYLLWLDSLSTIPNSAVVDFVTTNSAEIKNLFAYASKPINYMRYMAKNGTSNTPKQQEYDSGWAFIGGLNSTVFALTGGNFSGDTGPAIHFRESRTSISTPENEKYYSYREFLLGYDDIIMGETLKVGPYSPFYIQGPISAPDSLAATVSFNPTGLLLDDISFRSSKEEAEAADKLYFVLSSDNSSAYDRFVINFSGGYSESYRAAEDAIKMSRVYEDKPAVWILDETNTALVLNGLPMKDNREVRMGFSIPEAGDYTISLTPLQRQEVRNVVLVDNVSGKKVDLLQDSYSFSTGSVEDNNNRFVLYVNSSYTGTPTIDSKAPYAYTKDNLLTVKNLTGGDKVQVLDLAGRTVASGTVSGKEFSVALGQKGIYVVNVKGEKTSVLEVLNK